MDYRQHLPIGSELAGGYLIERVLGQGGFGITYQAFDRGLKVKVAIKEYFPAAFGTRDQTFSVRPMTETAARDFERFKKYFLEEAQLLAQFKHPSIVAVRRIFESGNTAYMVLEYEQGDSLKAWLEGKRQPPTQEQVDKIATQLLDAVSVLHRNDIIHRDIAPDNIIIRPDGSPVLLDFGSARRFANDQAVLGSQTITGIIKVGYSPPEQYAGKAKLQGAWTDLYSVGATLYRVVTGKTPVDSTERSLEDTLAPAVAAAQRRYRPDMLRAIDWCLRLKPGERPQSAAALRAALLAKAPPPKREDPRGEIKHEQHEKPRGWPEIGGRPVVIGLAALLILTGLAALLWPRDRDTGQSTKSGTGKVAGWSEPAKQRPVPVDAGPTEDQKREKQRRDQQEAEERQKRDAERQRAAALASLRTFMNYTTNGNDITYYRDVDQARCASDCVGDPRCKAYTFDLWNRMCFLKHTLGTLFKDPQYVTAVAPGSTPVFSSMDDQMDRYRNKAFPLTSAATRKEASFEDCQEFCLNESRCVAVTYQKGTRLCNWMTSAGEYQPNSDADSAVKRQIVK